MNGNTLERFLAIGIGCDEGMMQKMYRKCVLLDYVVRWYFIFFQIILIPIEDDWEKITDSKIRPYKQCKM